MTEALIGYGTEFWLSNLSTLVRMDEVLSVTTPNPQVSEVEATHFRSPNRRREYIAGLIEDGEGSIEMNYVAGGTTDELLRDALNDGLARDYMISIPTITGAWEITGQCIVKSYERNIPMDDRMTATVTVRFTGESTEGAS